MAASEIETAEKPSDERRWWQILEDEYFRPLSPYELRGEFERMLKKECGEDLTPERWDLMIEHIRDWYSGEHYEPTPEEVFADAEHQKKTFEYWDVMNALEKSLNRPLTIEDSKHQREATLGRNLTKKELNLEAYSFEYWGEYAEAVRKDAEQAEAAHVLGMNILFRAILSGGKEDGSVYSEDELDSLIKQHMTYEILQALISVYEPDASERATKGHAKRYPAIEFVKAEWAKHRLAYQNNKSEFARVYSRRVLNEHGVKVTDKQIREVWLKNPPVASNPDGMQATG